MEAELTRMYPQPLAPANHEVVGLRDLGDTLIMVATNPPIREFPNIVLFRRRGDGIERVMEGLSLGIQLDVSGSADLHTMDLANDFGFPPAKHDESIAAARRKMSELAIVDYGRFFHVQPRGPAPYEINKRAFHALRLKLFPELAKASGTKPDEKIELNRNAWTVDQPRKRRTWPTVRQGRASNSSKVAARAASRSSVV
jgi:hypothetical protein